MVAGGGRWVPPTGTQATASARATKNPTGHGRLGLSRGEET